MSEPTLQIVPVTKFFAKGPKPEVAHQTEDAGIDLKNNGDSFVFQNCTLYKIHTGLYVEIPKGKCGIIFERSGLGSKYGITIHGRIIDSGYRGEIIVLMSKVATFVANVGTPTEGYSSEEIKELRINTGDKVAQMVVVDCFPRIQEVDGLDKLSSSQRGEKGLGSSGK